MFTVVSPVWSYSRVVTMVVLVLIPVEDGADGDNNEVTWEMSDIQPSQRNAAMFVIWLKLLYKM